MTLYELLNSTTPNVNLMMNV